MRQTMIRACFRHIRELLTPRATRRGKCISPPAPSNAPAARRDLCSPPVIVVAYLRIFGKQAMAWVPKYFYDVFLSYAHADNEGPEEWVGGFKTRLEFQIGVNLGGWGGPGATVWWDENRMKPGASIRDSIIDALNRSATVVSLCSPHYLSSG